MDGQQHKRRNIFIISVFTHKQTDATTAKHIVGDGDGGTADSSGQAESIFWYKSEVEEK